MIDRGASVFVDTMVIIEACKINQWSNLCERYQIKSVQKCVEEIATGNQRRREHVEIDVEILVRQIKPFVVSDSNIARLIFADSNATGLDIGEKHLLAFLMTQDPSSLFVCSPDKACMRVGASIGLLDRFVSLEEMLPEAKKKLRENYTQKWLDREKTKIRLGTLT